MSRNRLRGSMFRATIHLAALLAICVGARSAARAAGTYTHHTGGGFYTVYYFDDNYEVTSIHYFGPENEYFGSEYFDGDGDPNPEGGSSGLASEDGIKLLAELLQKYGGAVTDDAHPWRHLFAHANSSRDLGPTVIDPAPFGGVALDDGGHGGGASGGFDPNVPFGEQIPNQKGSEDDDDGNHDNDKPDEIEFWEVDPDLIDPAPIDRNNAFVLLPPATQDHNPGGEGASSAGLDPQPIPWAAFGGGMTAYPPTPIRPGITGGR